MARFYFPQPLTPGEVYDLPWDVTQHIKVLRVNIHEPIVLFDGKGQEWQAVLVHQDKKSASAKILNPRINLTESPLKIHIAQGIARGEKMDFILQKATELGAAAFTPLTTRFCNVKIHSDRASHKQEHWEKVIISASEQSGRATLMSLKTPQKFSEFLASLPQASGLKLILHPTDPEITFKALLDSPDQRTPLTDIVLLIGPEGGFSPEELQGAQKAGFLRLSLGPHILRTETAALAAISGLQAMAGDF